MAALVSDLQWHYTAICWDGFYLTGARAVSGLDPGPEKNQTRDAQSAGNLSDEEGSSETIRSATPEDESDAEFNDWLAGLIDADGGFYLSKQGYASCEIIMHSKEVQTLAFIKSQIGGKVTPRIGSNSVRWRLHNAQGMDELLHRINGRIRNTTKLGQLSRVFAFKGLELLHPTPLTVNNGWISGFFCGDGHFAINSSNYQPSIQIGQKDEDILRQIAAIWGGNVYPDKSRKGWIYWLSRRLDLKLFTVYLNIHNMHNPFKVAKLKSFERYLRYMDMGYHLDPSKQAKMHKFISHFCSIGS